MWEIVRHLMLMCLVFLLAYVQIDKHIFYNNRFVRMHGLNPHNAGNNVSKHTDIYDYLQMVIDNGLYHNDSSAEGFFNEKRAYFMQVPRVRQFRMNERRCKTPKAFSSMVKCIAKFTTRAAQDVGAYGESWSHNIQSPINTTAWMYNYNDTFAFYKGLFD